MGLKNRQRSVDMFGTKKKQRSALPEKQQLTKYYEMDGALRAYANRMGPARHDVRSVRPGHAGPLCLCPVAAAGRDPRRQFRRSNRSWWRHGEGWCEWIDGPTEGLGERAGEFSQRG